MVLFLSFSANDFVEHSVVDLKRNRKTRRGYRESSGSNQPLLFNILLAVLDSRSLQKKNKYPEMPVGVELGIEEVVDSLDRAWTSRNQHSLVVRGSSWFKPDPSVVRVPSNIFL